MLLRYYETTGKTRHEKVKETLETMGASILLGGLTTFIGVIPLAFSTTTIFMVVFKSFLAMVCLGCGVGLTLLPVLLSLVGPVVSAQDSIAFVETKEMVKDHEEKCSIAGSSKDSSSLPSTEQGVSGESDSSTDEEADGRSSDEDEQVMHLVQSTSPTSKGIGYEIEV